MSQARQERSSNLNFRGSAPTLPNHIPIMYKKSWDSRLKEQSHLQSATPAGLYSEAQGPFPKHGLLCSLLAPFPGRVTQGQIHAIAVCAF